jgi:hypothetical protein
MWLRTGTRSGLYGNELYGSIKCGEFLDQLRTGQLLKKTLLHVKTEATTACKMSANTYLYPFTAAHNPRGPQASVYKESGI